jgi:hypothetical protein
MIERTHHNILMTLENMQKSAGGGIPNTTLKIFASGGELSAVGTPIQAGDTGRLGYFMKKAARGRFANFYDRVSGAGDGEPLPARIEVKAAQRRQTSPLGDPAWHFTR